MDKKSIYLKARPGYTSQYSYNPDPYEGSYKWDYELQTWVKENAIENCHVSGLNVPQVIETLNEVSNRFINPEEVLFSVESEYDTSTVKMVIYGDRVANEKELKRIEQQIAKEEKQEEAKQAAITKKANATRERNKLLKQQEVQEFIASHPGLKVEPK